MPLTREEILRDYAVDSHGLITTPGKFEREWIFAPYFWSAGMEGFADEDIDGVWFFDVSEEDRRLFPEIDAIAGIECAVISISENDQGFVNSGFHTREEANELIDGLNEDVAEDD